MKLPPLPQSKSGRIKLAGGAAAALLILILLFSSGGKNNDRVIIPAAVPEKPVAPVAAAPVAPPNVDNSQIILELFNPSDQTLTHQLNQTTISQQIEQTMTVSFVLTRCQIISQDDYRDTFQALVAYAMQTKLGEDQASADAAVRQIAESSKASYALIYSRTSCTDKELPTLASQVLSWTRNVLKK